MMKHTISRSILRSTAPLIFLVCANQGMSQERGSSAQEMAEQRLSHYVNLLDIDEAQQKAMMAHFVEGEEAVVKIRQECASKAKTMVVAMERHVEQGGAPDDPAVSKAITPLKEECMAYQERIEKAMAMQVSGAHRILTPEQLERMDALRQKREWNPSPGCCELNISAVAKPVVIDRSKGCCSWINVEERDRAAMEAKHKAAEDPARRKEEAERQKKEESSGESKMRLTPQESPTLTSP